ncbi:DNA damage-binding protein 1 [Patellaria atrata CBS 101060]|uniref:DNA damage-binding protein 1 n=1 Tax=Patellaria atrata CBS 101060 TaxID=1346257 RepID=A0A9P4SC67_9PEZI|nr:DNA damage-binding protein 1 [Patellaria atrata CBS 101060]
MAYLAPIHRATSVRHAIKLNLLTPDEECLVVAKANRLELYHQTEDGLSLLYTRTIYGKVTILHKIRPASSQTDHLFVATDRFMYFTLSWNSDSKQFQTERSYIDLADKGARDSQTGDRLLVDPSGKFITLEIYEGVVNVIPIIQKTKKTKPNAEIGGLGEPLPARIPELFVRSSAFLQRKLHRPKMVILYQNNLSQRVYLKFRHLVYDPGMGNEAGSVDLEDAHGYEEEINLGASHIIPVSEPAYGILILCETLITYIDDITEEAFSLPLDEATIFVCWERIDNQRFILADDYGRLYLLMLILNKKNAVIDWKLDVLGQTSRASTLVYLDAGRIFVGSHQGDSQVIQIIEGSIEILQTFNNLGPILDFTIMDMGNRSGEGYSNEYSTGQARLVTCSGAYQDGSLRSVRSGVGLEDLGVLCEMGHILNMFELKSDHTSRFEDTLLVSLIGETRVFRFSGDGDVEEVDDFKGLDLSDSTLHAGNLPSNRLLQITNTTVQVIDLDSGMKTGAWTVPNSQSITAVAANDDHVAVAIGGTHLVILSVGNDVSVRSKKVFRGESQVSCLTLPDIAPNICAVGFWEGPVVSFLTLDNLEVIETVIVADDEVAIPRSLLLTQVIPGKPPTLFIALADGNVITYSVDLAMYALSERKSIVLGTQQASFRELPRGIGLYNVFATCEHPSLIYGSEGRIIYSSVTAEKATSVCPFDAEAYPGAVAIATSEDIRIAVIDPERTTHVQTMAVNQTVRRIAYSPSLKGFGLGTIKRTLKDKEEIVESFFKLVDEVIFKELDTFALNEDELVESVIRAELNDGSGGLAERFVVGTAYLDDPSEETARGRILVFEVTEDRLLKVVTEVQVMGACRCLGIMEGKIVAALMKTIVIYKFEYTSTSTPSLKKTASYRTSTAPIDIVVTGRTIAIADMMRSLSIVEFTPGTGGLPDTLVEIARHFETVWSTAVAELAENTYVESDVEGNLRILYRDVQGVTNEDKRRLVVSSEMRLSEMINKIRRIDVATSPDAAVVPRGLVATVEGSIYLLALITPKFQNVLMTLQSNLADCVQSPGHVPFQQYRAFKTRLRESKEPMRFVDGELVEKFLDVDAEVQERCITGLGMGVEEVKELVEGLRRLR